MKYVYWIVLSFVLLFMVAVITVEAQHIKDRNIIAQASPKADVQPVILKCPKCQNDMEQGFILEIEGSANNDKGATEWVQGPAQKSFFEGVKLKGRKRLQIEAFRCTNCGYLELYAK